MGGEGVRGYQLVCVVEEGGRWEQALCVGGRGRGGREGGAKWCACVFQELCVIPKVV